MCTCVYVEKLLIFLPHLVWCLWIGVGLLTSSRTLVQWFWLVIQNAKVRYRHCGLIGLIGLISLAPQPVWVCISLSFIVLTQSIFLPDLGGWSDPDLVLRFPDGDHDCVGNADGRNGASKNSGRLEVTAIKCVVRFRLTWFIEPELLLYFCLHVIHNDDRPTVISYFADTVRSVQICENEQVQWVYISCWPFQLPLFLLAHHTGFQGLGITWPLLFTVPSHVSFSLRQSTSSWTWKWCHWCQMLMWDLQWIDCISYTTYPGSSRCSTFPRWGDASWGSHSLWRLWSMHTSNQICDGCNLASWHPANPDQWNREWTVPLQHCLQLAIKGGISKKEDNIKNGSRYDWTCMKLKYLKHS